MIEQFKGEHRFLSNFAPVPHGISMQGVRYPTVENAFQAAKTLVPEQRERFVCCRPDEAKRLGRTVTLRPGWDDMRLEVMLRMLRMKFRRGTRLAQMLLDTGDVELREGNYWNDTFWGWSLQKQTGENHLGKLLMQVRSELRRAALEADDLPWNAPG